MTKRQIYVYKPSTEATRLIKNLGMDPEEVRRYDEGCFEESDMVHLIKTYLLSQSQKQWLFDNDFDLHDLLNGRHASQTEITNMFTDWNFKAGFKMFYSGL